MNSVKDLKGKISQLVMTLSNDSRSSIEQMNFINKLVELSQEGKLNGEVNNKERILELMKSDYALAKDFFHYMLDSGFNDSTMNTTKFPSINKTK